MNSGSEPGPANGHATERTALVPGSAREAYRLNDVEASRFIHDKKFEAKEHNENHEAAGAFIKSMIFGGLDGILTSFAIVAGAAGGNLGIEAVLVLGFSNIFADAFSMGIGEYLSSKAHNEYVMRERAREAWELNNYREGEIKEMVDIYSDKGLSREDADLIVRTMAKYDSFFVDVMMVEELGLQVPDPQEDLIKEGVIMFLSFSGFGALPLLGYAVCPLLFPNLPAHTLFLIACAVTAITLFLMGAVKARFTTRRWYVSALEMLVLGGCCAAVAYEIGSLVNALI